MIKGIINERCLRTSSMHMWQFKNGWVTQFTKLNDTVRSLFRQQIIKIFYLIYFEKNCLANKSRLSYSVDKPFLLQKSK